MNRLSKFCCRAFHLLALLALAGCSGVSLPLEKPLPAASALAISSAQIKPLDALASFEAQAATPALSPAAVPAAQNLWWLTQPRITTAWNYSMGYDWRRDRPVRVAVIDVGFAGMHIAMRPGKDLEGQVLWNEGSLQVRQADGTTLRQPWTPELLAAEDQEEIVDGRLIKIVRSHGTSAISTIVSRLNDGSGIAGVAPQARAVPFKVGNGGRNTWEEVIEVLEHISALPPEKKIDVVSISLWGGSARTFYLPWGPEHRGYGSYPQLKAAVAKLDAQGTVLVAAAGNGGWNVERNFPAGLRDQQGKLLFPEIVTVGAIQRDETRAIFKPDAPHQRQYASNWGPGIDIWAPGHNMAAIGSGTSTLFDVLTNQRVLQNSGEIMPWNGTSAATPLIAGIIALLKAQNPALQREQIVGLLQTSLRRKTYQDKLLRTHPFLSPTEVVSECGFVNEYMHCGELYAGDLSLQMVDAVATLEAEAGHQAAQALEGRFAADGSFTSADGQSLQLSFGSAPIDGYYAEGTGSAYVPVADLIKNQSEARLTGWRKGGRFYLQRISVMP